MNLCPADNRPVEIVLDLERLAREQPNTSWYQPDRPDMWRFGGLMALDANDPNDRRHIISLGEGHTPELAWKDHPLALSAGFTLTVKDEGIGHQGWGANPTGSFKDRGMAMAISMARHHGLKRLAVPTQGNAGDSMCAYVEAAGLEAVVAMPNDTPAPIQRRVQELAESSDRFNLVCTEGTIRESGEALKRDWIPNGWFSVATFQEPGWRIDGKKTLGLEVAEPSKHGDPWSLPDVVVYPTGGGTGVLGMWKAWDELEALGMIGPERPRVVCVQSEATAPLVAAFESGATDTSPADAGQTLAFGLNVPGGVGHFRVLQIVRESGGLALAIPESAILSEFTNIQSEKGWSVCPEGAACIAALPRLIDQGVIRPGDRVVAFNTGSMEKYLPELQHLL